MQIDIIENGIKITHESGVVTIYDKEKLRTLREAVQADIDELSKEIDQYNNFIREIDFAALD